MQELENFVDVHAHTLRARERVNGRLHEISQPEAANPSWWQRFFKWETLTVAGRTIEKGFVVSPFLAGLITVVLGVMLTALLTVGGTVYWRLSDRLDKQAETSAREARDAHDLLIRLDQRLIDKQAQDEKTERDRKNKDDLQDLQIRNVELALNGTRKGKS